MRRIYTNQDIAVANSRNHTPQSDHFLKACDFNEAVELMRRLGPTLTSLMRRKRRPCTDIDDIRQEIAVSIVEFVRRSNKLPIDGEVVLIANRRVADYFRAKFKTPVVNVGAAIEVAPQLDLAVRQTGCEAKCIVRRLLKQLRPQARCIIIRRYLRSESVAEIAASIDMTTEGVYSSLRR